MCLASGTQWFHLTHMGNVFSVNPFYNGVLYSLRKKGLRILDLTTRFNKIATQGAPQMGVDKEANSLSRVYSYYSKFNLRLFYV